MGIDEEPVTTPELESTPVPGARSHLIERIHEVRQLARDYQTFAGSHAVDCRCRECRMARAIPALLSVAEVAIKIDRTSAIPDANNLWRTLHWTLEALERVLAEG